MPPKKVIELAPKAVGSEVNTNQCMPILQNEVVKQPQLV